MSRVVSLVVICVAVDAVALLTIGFSVGWSLVSAQMIASGFLGAMVIGYALWRYGRAVAERMAGEEPLGDLAAGPLLLLAGALLLMPGFFTDLLGLVLLFPPVRRTLLAWVRAFVETRGTAGQSRPEEPVTVKFDRDSPQALRRAA